jgi:CheY-like chemotaxis protein
MVAMSGKIVVETVHGVKEELRVDEFGLLRRISAQSNRLALLVEDSLVNQQLLTKILEHEGYRVIVAVNGRDGFNKFKQDSIDLVIMDIQMPVMDGLEATRLIRAHELKSGSRTPIIAVTAGIERERCLDAGADEHIEKPAGVSVVRELLRRY